MAGVLSVGFNDGTRARTAFASVNGSTFAILTQSVANSVAFGDVLACTSNSITVTVANSSDLAATGVHVTLLGTGLSLSSNSCGTPGADATVGGASSCHFTLNYHPLLVGALQGGSFAISYFDGQGLQSIATTTVTGNSLNPVTVGSAPSNLTYPLRSNPRPPLSQGMAAPTTFPITATNTCGSPVYSCTYRTLGLASTDPNYVPAGGDCGALGSLVNVSGVI
ncbi:MAG TPA: hypothetical protein VL588_09735, partial [Bdellovibrionota bacterium]|nr:hypothetical protein [Bdellovibrionota bacterium]